MTSYLFRAPSGVPGGVTRIDNSVIEPGFLEAEMPYGSPVKIGTDGKMALMGAGSVAAEFYGVVTRIAPAISGVDETYAGADANPLYFQGIIVDGYVAVVCAVGVPSRGYQAFVRVVDAGPGFAVGQFEATADGANNVALVGVTWGCDGKDTGNIAELRIMR